MVFVGCVALRLVSVIRKSRCPTRKSLAMHFEMSNTCNEALGFHGQFSKIGSLRGYFFLWVPYYIGDPERDLNLENYPYGLHALLPDSLGRYQ